MKKLNKAISCIAVLISTTSANAQDQTQQDPKIIEEAFAALHAKNFHRTIENTNLVIKRFEGGKNADSNYVCTNGLTDTVAAMLGAAVTMERGNATKDKTSAISQDICTAYFLKGFALVDLNQRAEALPNFEMAVHLDPDNQHYINELAEWYKSDRQWEKSLELFTAASEVTDLSVETMDNKKEAKQTLNSMRCRSYRGIAFNHVELKRWDAARAALKKCLAIIPGESNSRAELEYIKANSGN